MTRNPKRILKKPKKKPKKTKPKRKVRRNLKNLRKKKEKKKRGGKKRKAEKAPATPKNDRPQRERKSVTKFKFDDRKEKEVLDIKEGKGVALGEHPNVEQNLTKVKAVDPVLKKLHRILFGTVGKKLTVKRNIRKFSGFVVEGDKAEFKDDLETKLGKFERVDLKEIANILDTESSGSKVELVENLAEFLLDPKPSKTKKSGGVKRRRSTKKGAKKGKKEKGKRRLTGYMLFGKEHRPKVRKENPDLGFGETTKEVAKLWNELSDKQKEKYNDRAREGGDDDEEEEDEDDEEEKPKKKSKKGTKKKEKKEKKGKKKKSKKDKSDEEDEEEEKEEKEKEPDLPAEVKDKLKTAVKDIIAKSDDDITNKTVRAELKKTKEFSDIIKKHKKYVKELINQLASDS